MPATRPRRRGRRGRGHGPGASPQYPGGSAPSSRSRRSRRLTRWLAYAAVVLVAAAVIAGFAVSGFANTGGPNPQDDNSGNADPIGDQHNTMSILFPPGNHMPRGDNFAAYSTSPPTSGPHWGTGWAQCGIYSDEDDVPDERIVHNMEHGQVLISYNLTDKAQIDQLKDVARSLQDRRSWMIMRPYSSLPAGQIVVHSWGWLQRFASIDEPGIRAFYDAHINRGPESINCLSGG